MDVANSTDVQSRFCWSLRTDEAGFGDILKLVRKTSVVLLVVLIMTGCANLVSGLTMKMADDLAYTILNSDDLDTVREGIPAYLLLIDSFLRSSPDNQELLLAASSLNGSYSIFADEERARLLTAKSLAYALKAACVSRDALCDFRSLGFQDFQALADKIGAADVPVIYAVGVAWTSWIQANSDDWSAIAELAKVRYLMERVILLDETWENGGPHLYMGGLETIFPAAMGGHPEKGREHFERALAVVV